MHPRFARRCEVRASGGSRIRAGSMANVTLKNIKKIYPNADTKKKKKKKEHTSDEPKANLQITDEGVVAVQEFSLDIADREFIVLVGPSGCGKSTTLRMIAGLEEITDGELYIGDRLVNDVAPKDRDIAMVFQNYALYPHMTVYENMAFSLKLKKVPKQEIDKIRGVKSDHAVNKLVEYNLVQELGRLDAPGRPIVFGTTEEFLRNFGVDSTDNLPEISPVKMEDFRAEVEEEMQIKLDV